MVYATIDASQIKTTAAKKGAKAKRIRDYSQPLQAAATYLKKKTLSNFDAEISPEGVGWAALSPKTIERKGHSRKLYETGAMRSAISARVEGKQAVISCSDFKAPFHQSGTSRMPARPFIGTNWAMINEIKGLVKNYIKGR